MNWNLIIIGFNILLIVSQIIVLSRKLSSEKGFSYLPAICGFFWGFLFYFFLGFQIDDGTCQENEIPVVEFGFVTSAVLGVVSVLSMVLNFLLKKRT